MFVSVYVEYVVCVYVKCVVCVYVEYVVYVYCGCVYVCAVCDMCSM
jgi:hypothetical protein